MKKLLLGLILCAGLTSCSCSELKHDNTDESTSIGGYTGITKIEGHKYIIARTWGISQGGICIIHAESCECKNKNKEN